jgi:CheY-like chemotaxis protein
VSARLVVADDDEGIRTLIVAALKGYAVLEADGGATALTLVRQEQPDLVVLDVQMPDLDGLEVVRVLAADPVTAAIPVIVCSGAGPAVQRAATQERTVCAFVAKPFTVRTLRATVDQVLSTRDQVRSAHDVSTSTMR